MSADTSLTREDIDENLKELGKEFRRLTNGKMDAEIIIVGGSAVVLNHDFREATNNIDAMIEKGSALETAAERVSDKLGIRQDWFNTDFQYTSSYSDVLREVSVHYRTFSNHIDVRVVPDEYVIAMKLVSNRDYKHDHSDIVGILRDHAKNGESITKDQIESAVERLYDSVDAVSGRAWEFLDNVIKDGDYDKLYEITSVNEQENELLLTDEIEQNSGIVQTASMNDILAELRDQGVDDDVSDDLSAG